VSANGSTPGSPSRHANESGTPLLAASILLPFVIGFVLCVWWTRTDRLLLTGDEPHYLIMADSVALDHDFDLRNNYTEDAITGRIYGEVEPHAYRYDQYWPPYHSPGLGLLLALPFRYGGVDGVRIALLTWAVLLPLALVLWMRPHASEIDLLLLALALGLSVPLAFGGVVVYPDLPAAAILAIASLACLNWFLVGETPPSGPWVLVWTLVGFLPWLQTRYAPVWLLLVAAGWWLAFRAARPSRARLMAGLVPAFVGAVLLAWFNWAYYQSILGPPRWPELTGSPMRAAMVFLGLHLDQSQGLFVQQPLWLLGLVAALPFARRHPIAALWITLVYLAAIVPPSLQMGRYGGGGPLGRYGWAAAFLWIVPVRHVVASTRASGARWFRWALLAGIAAQVLLAVRWMAQPTLLRPNLDERIWLRDSLFPELLKPFLPSFYFWDFTSYWFYPPNMVAMAVAALLLAAGALVARGSPAGSFEAGNPVESSG
jgi:hypothetical protein